MPRPLALALTLAFIAYLFWRDVKEKPRITTALWIPFLWMLTSGSRPLSRWLSWGGAGGSVAGIEDGSPIDRLVYSGLIAVGLFVLTKRRLRLWEVIRNNKWLTLYFVYCFAAIFWSDFPFVAFKRWIKCIGEPVMVLVLMTEPAPMEALTRLMKRCAYLLIPLSICYIKYFPEFGRSFNVFTGYGENNGVALDKNGLGYLCMVLGTFFFVHLLRTRKLEQTTARRNELILTAGFIWMIWWCMIQAQSSTALMGLIIAMLVVVVLGLPMVSRRFVGVYVLAGIALIAIAEVGFGLSAGIIAMLGEDSTLTGRTALWDEILPMAIHPLFGAGFESFWLGDRLAKIWAHHWWRPTQSHNGYIEVYLNLGAVGLALLFGLIIVTFRKGSKELVRDFDFGRYRLATLASIIAYNWTEAAFKTLHLVFLVLYIIAIDYPSGRSKEAAESVPKAEPPPQRERPTPRAVAAAARTRPPRWGGWGERAASGQGQAGRPFANGRLPFTVPGRERKW
jgi:exopolysaccharide production protein ExoQ